MMDPEAEIKQMLMQLARGIRHDGTARDVALIDIIEAQQSIIDGADRRVATYVRFYRSIYEAARKSLARQGDGA
jgi:hypothetical protein